MSGYYQSMNPPGCQNALTAHLSEIQTWLLRNFNLVNESFKELNNADEIDLWPFLTITNVYYLDHIPVWRRTFVHIAFAVEICKPTTPSHQLSGDVDVQPPDQTIIFYSLLPHIRSWLASVDLLGKCAITSERHVVAFLHTLRFLFRQPAALFRQIIDNAAQNEDKWPALMRLARRAFFKFVDFMPLSMDTYVLLLLMYSIVAELYTEGHGHIWSKRGYPVAYTVKRYLGKVCPEDWYLYNCATDPKFQSFSLSTNRHAKGFRS